VSAQVEWGVSLQHTLAHLARLQILVRREIWHTRLERGERGDDEYRGLYVSDADIDVLLDERERPTVGISRPDFSTPLRAVEEHISSLEEEARAAGELLPLECLVSLFGLSSFERDVILICLGVELDLRYERLYAYLQDDVTKKRPTVDLVGRLLGVSVESRLAQRLAFEAHAPLLRWDLVTIHDDPGARRPVLLARYLKLDDRIAGFLIGSNTIDSRLVPWFAPSSGRDGVQLTARVEQQLARWSREWKWHTAASSPVVLVHGRYGNGQLSAAQAIANAAGRGLLVLDVSDTGGGADAPFAQRLRLAEREALLTNSLLCWSGVDGLLHADHADEAEQRAFVRALAHSAVPSVLLAERTWEPARALGQRPFLRLELGDTTYAERRELWAAGLNGTRHLANADLTALAGRFRLSPGQIQDAISRARTIAWIRDPGTDRISAGDIDAACRVQAQHRLGALARKLEPRYDWDDIVLPTPQLSTLRLVATMIRQRPVVYGEWGFDRKLAMGKGVISLFAGASGTGKTMAAEILARDLGLDLYRIDLSSVVNKYIGETEKNLERLFREAQDTDAILFFDEADALFGKRSGVSDAHDRYANIETAYLLQRTEEYDGLVILASNLPKNLDDAFVRRIHFTINFPIPEEPERREIWRRAFPREAPREPDLDLDFLARRLKISGGNIRNIILAAAFLAAEVNAPIGMQHLMRGAAFEFQKMGRMLLETDFGPYLELVRAPSAIVE
jgi:hypothetical protein